MLHFIFTSYITKKAKHAGNHTKEDHSDDERKISQLQIQTQEETFQKISTEIHDNISLLLTISRLFLSDLDFNDTPNVEKKVNESITLLKQAIHDLNNLSRSLSSDQLERFGLPSCIQSLVDRVTTLGIDTHFSCEGIYSALSEGNDLILFRIVQEAFRNSLNHSHATSIEISLKYGERSLSVSVSDNGIGFDKAAVTDIAHGAGLSNMKKRAQLLNAKLTIDTQHSSGTTVTIDMPLPNHKTANANRKQHSKNCPCG